ncbi:iron uptake porin [Romeria aff. gracilis LEGE 07310]|uniref:Iron uptake porin n=2 Tax=Vasconcelosia TaxID=3366328 RepID=A0A8J7AFW0_9CYAN|nr:iron uptake porin [Romeria aff. gracilis LEGE 07310]
MFWRTLLVYPAALGAALAFSGSALAAEPASLDSLLNADSVSLDDAEKSADKPAAEPIAAPTELASANAPAEAPASTAPVSVEALSNEPVQLAQVTSVSELSDVQPSDWAYTALQRLVEEYGCIEGYPDRTYRGNRALTRYEFAAGLNACLDVVVQLIGPDGDLDTIRRLQEEFAAELATLRGRVDTIEADVAELEANQFSTTTKLRGQLDAHLIVPIDEPIVQGLPGEDPQDEEVTFDYRARLNFDTSFTGEDRLRIRLQANSGQTGLTAVPGGLANGGGSSSSIFSEDAASGEDNVALNDVYYSFPIGSRISAIIAANSITTDDFVTSTIVPFDGPSVADFGGPQFYDIFSGGSSFAAGVNFAFTDNLILDLGYATDDSDNPNEGIFENYSYIAQLNLLDVGPFNVAATYIDGDQEGIDYTAAGLVSLNFGNFEVGGYYSYIDLDDGETDSWMGGISISDFLGAGNTLGGYYGRSPIFPDGALDTIDRNPYVAEVYYEIGLNEFFTLTPAVIYSDPNQPGDGFGDALYGVLRSTFNF